MMRYDLIDLLAYFESTDNTTLPVIFEGKYMELMIELRKGIFISQRTYAEDLIEWNSVVHGKIYLLTS